MKYQVTIACTTECYAPSEVEASTPEEAARIAWESYQSGDWPPMEAVWDCSGDDRIASIQDDAGNICDIPDCERCGKPLTESEAAPHRCEGDS